MINSEVTQVQIQIIINNNLYKKNVIDENTFFYVNDKLLRKLNLLSMRLRKEEDCELR